MEYIYQAGEQRALAALPGRFSYNIEPWEARQPLIPRASWRPLDLRGYLAPVLDQGSSSACVGFSFVTAFRRAWLQSGQADHNFSPWWVYGLINGGRDQGAMVGDAVEAAQQYGVALTGTVEGDLIPRIWYPQQLKQMAPQLAKAKRFRLSMAWHLRPPNVFEQIASALQLGFTVVSGLYIGRNFGQLDDEGVAPLPDQVVGGHALAHVGMQFSAKRRQWLIATQNSWSANWGRGGYCYLQERAWDQMADALAILAAADDAQDPTGEVPLPVPS